MSNKYSVGAGLAGIYAGVLNKDGFTWKDKNDVTDDAINAVRDYMVDQILGGIYCVEKTEGGYQWKLKDGRVVKMIIKVEKEEK